MERGWDAGRRRVRAVVNRERNETDGMRKEGSERGWQRVCRSSIGRFSPRSSIHPHSRQRARLRLHQRLHPPLDGLGQSGRRREADKRIALSSRNDIFDQHFHITPAEALSRASLRSLTLRFFSFFHPPFPSNFSSHSACYSSSLSIRSIRSILSLWRFLFLLSYPFFFRQSPPHSQFRYLFLSRFSSSFLLLLVSTTAWPATAPPPSCKERETTLRNYVWGQRAY